MSKTINLPLWIGSTGRNFNESKHYIIAAKTLKEAAAVAPEGVMCLSPHAFQMQTGGPTQVDGCLIIADGKED